METFDFINDPITAAQVKTLASLLGEQWSEKARDGFLVASGRFVSSRMNPAPGQQNLAQLQQTQITLPEKPVDPG